MKKTIIAVILILFMGQSFAQEKDSPEQGWTKSGVVSLNLSQVALSNWSQGGQSSLSYSLLGNFGAKYVSNPWVFRSSMKIIWGRTKLGKEDYRIVDNEFFWDQILEYNFGNPIEAYVSNTIKTVVAKGFEYEDGDGNTINPPNQISSFWDPGYLNQGIGGTYKEIPGLVMRLGLGFKETFTNDFNSYSDDPTTIDKEKFKLETGIDFGLDGKWSIEENILFQTKLNLFGKFDNLNIWDVRWDNTLTAKIAKHFNVNLNVLVVYDEDQSLETQVKEALQIGITYSIF